MFMGIRFQAHPTAKQKQILSQWMGCSNFIWKAKCEEEHYLSSFARKYLPVGTYAPINATYAQYKNEELSPWLKNCPSQVLRNSASNWYHTYQNHLKGLCGKPKKKKKSEGGSIYLTRELFRFERCEDGVTRLFIGTKRNNMGYLSVKFHHKLWRVPQSITIKKKYGQYSVSFCYDDASQTSSLPSSVEQLEGLRSYSEEQLKTMVVGVDRGVVIPVQCGKQAYQLTKAQERKKQNRLKYIKHYQRKLSRQVKGSQRRYQTKVKIHRAHQKIAHIRKDFCHQTSRAIVDQKTTQIIIFEDLKIKNMTKRPKAKQKEDGTWEYNKAKAKGGLNRSILAKGWFQLENYTQYKAERAQKVVFKISALYTSQECANCSHTHPDNRKTQAWFVCQGCGYAANADYNAAEVIKKRAIRLIIDSGTELSKNNVLLDSGRGAKIRREAPRANHAMAVKRQKRRESLQERVLEATPIHRGPVNALA